MKRNISDLLDDLSVQDVELNNLSPLSSLRIKEITMKKVNNNYRPRRSLGRKLLIAAAIVAMLVFSVFAAQKITGAGDWFRAEKNLSDSQVELVNKLGDTFKPQTYTDQGTTIEAKAAYADDYMLYLYLSVTAPEGTVLPDGIIYSLFDYNAVDYSDPDSITPFDLGGEAHNGLQCSNIRVVPLSDNDPTDNCKDFMVVLTAEPSGNTRLNDGRSKFLAIGGVYEQVPNVDGDEDGYKMLAPGKFVIDITLSNRLESVELDVNGIRYGGVKTRTWTHEGACFRQCQDNITDQRDPETGRMIHAETFEYYVTARSMTLSNMSVSWKNDYEVRDPNMSAGLHFSIVMKDGSVVETIMIDGGVSYGDVDITGTVCFTAPINLDEVDYVIIGDPDVGETYKVYLSEE